MEHSFTQNDLIRFIYLETEVMEHLDIMETIENDILLREQHQELEVAINALPKIVKSPSKGSITKILNYSSTTALAPQA